MTITISINPTYPAFASLPPEQLIKVAVGIGPTGMNTMFFSYDYPTQTLANTGDAGVNQAAMMVSYRRPVTFSHEAFGVFGNVVSTDYSSSRLANLLADYVSRGVLKVRDNTGAVDLTPAQILKFTP